MEIDSKLKRAVLAYMATNLLSCSELDTIYHAFIRADENGYGVLSREHMLQLLSDLNSHIGDVDNIFGMFDLDSDGVIGYTDFLCMGLYERELTDPNKLTEIFHILDRNHDRFVTVDDLKEVL